MKKQIVTFLLIVLVSCSGSIVLESEDKSKRLIYSCGSFESQAKTPKDIRILALSFKETLKSAAKSKDIVYIQSATNAFSQRDWKRLERLIVEYKCKNRR